MPSGFASMCAPKTQALRGPRSKSSRLQGARVAATARKNGRSTIWSPGAPAEVSTSICLAVMNSRSEKWRSSEMCTTCGCTPHALDSRAADGRDPHLHAHAHPHSHEASGESAHRHDAPLDPRSDEGASRRLRLELDL